MPVRSIEASSARPSQTPIEGCADDASSLKSNTVAQIAGVFEVQAAISKEGFAVKASRLWEASCSIKKLLTAPANGRGAERILSRSDRASGYAETALGLIYMDSGPQARQFVGLRLNRSHSYIRTVGGGHGCERLALIYKSQDLI
jgi:hypothetical protein